MCASVYGYVLLRVGAHRIQTGLWFLGAGVTGCPTWVMETKLQSSISVWHIPNPQADSLTPTTPIFSHHIFLEFFR